MPCEHEGRGQGYVSRNQWTGWKAHKHQGLRKGAGPESLMASAGPDPADTETWVSVVQPPALEEDRAALFQPLRWWHLVADPPETDTSV